MKNNFRQRERWKERSIEHRFFHGTRRWSLVIVYLIRNNIPSDFGPLNVRRWRRALEDSGTCQKIEAPFFGAGAARSAPSAHLLNPGRVYVRVPSTTRRCMWAKLNEIWPDVYFERGAGRRRASPKTHPEHMRLARTICACPHTRISPLPDCTCPVGALQVASHHHLLIFVVTRGTCDNSWCQSLHNCMINRSMWKEEFIAVFALYKLINIWLELYYCITLLLIAVDF